MSLFKNPPPLPYLIVFLHVDDRSSEGNYEFIAEHNTFKHEELRMKESPAPQSSLVLYQTEDGTTRIECRFEEETLWLTQAQMSELFQTSVPNISLHLKSIYEEGELFEKPTIKYYLTVQNEKGRQVSRELMYYSLPAILAVGYRVRSQRGTQFRQWATARLSEYLVKGFTMDDERLKNPPGPGVPDYFDELLERIRDIRSSERRFYQKVLDIYATSADYRPDAETSHLFFATVQNKMHWAAHGHTAAEIIHERSDAHKPQMGLTSTHRTGVVRKQDVSIAKNYLEEDELRVLNRIVNAYIEFAELQAMNRRTMTMVQWITKLDEFLQLSGRELLDHAGKISAETAKLKAESEYEKFKHAQDALPKPIDADFEKVVKQLEAPAKKASGNKRSKNPE
jgi:hypothetical protein